MKKTLIILFVAILIYTRFVNLQWGLPYPFHPDERNMADGIVRLHCEFRSDNFNLTDCFNPKFFAYGQFPLYVGYALVQVSHMVSSTMGSPVTFIEAVLALRFISFVSSLLTAWVLLRTISYITKKQISISSIVLVTFVPIFIQYAHFGTTESILMLLISGIFYESLRMNNDQKISSKLYILAILTGLAVSIKISSIIYTIIPFYVLFTSSSKKYNKINSERIFMVLYSIFLFSTVAILSCFLFSPQNAISFLEFASSMKYESAVALGTTIPFYTRQFLLTTPVWFQIVKIFPYALGWPVFILSVLGLFFLSPHDKKFNLLRVAVLGVFIPSAFVYAKWTRFVAASFPLMFLLAYLFLDVYLLNRIKETNKNLFFKIVLIIVVVLPGVAFTSIYTQPDVRFQASQWIYKHISNSAFIFSETANVIDIPIESPNDSTPVPSYNYDSFNLYDVDTIPDAKVQFQEDLQKASYIFIPSRRIFMNLSCSRPNNSLSVPSEKKCAYLKHNFSTPYSYYDDLFSGKLGFTQIAEFTSYPRISIGGKTIIEFPDEDAEESFTVFDHPVIRIYKRNSI